MSGNHARRTDAGFTLIEVMISVVILGGIFYATFRVIGSAQDMMRSTSLVAQSERQAMDLARNMEVRMRNGGISQILDGAGAAFADGATKTNGVRIRLVADYNGAQVYGRGVGFVVNTKESNPTDGVDNNGNNLVDEVDLRFREWAGVPTGASVRDSIVGRDIRGVSVTRSGNRLTITVTTQHYDPITRQLKNFTGSSTLLIRNP